MKKGKAEVQSARKGSWFSVANLDPVPCKTIGLLAMKKVPLTSGIIEFELIFELPKNSFHQATLEETIESGQNLLFSGFWKIVWKS